MSKKVLLIADDDEMNRTIIKRFLKNTFDIIEAENGRKTMDIIESRKVDALLLDIIMPEMDGLEVLKCIMQDDNCRNMAILVATSTKEKTERTALSLGADDVVSKPFDPIVIQKRLENILIMKEAKAQKEMLEHDDIDALLKTRTEVYARKVDAAAERLHRIAEIIHQNKDNKKLLAELAGDIHKEADEMASFFSENK